ncbi:phosphonate metabolism 15-bisphosphokinase (PRPP-forming) PhnN [Desulfovibrio sp. X2]|uniref:ribose 1,5-bisphosphokinase n=1 Tax=Desulfovibrio sp. X2 TaxID=941449 RepID=UPI000358824D|nr:ribose 1,5-bisphosphokinase [Desulfovibrio sp. X2]EPR43816.1 phosphonate metabolism 15-bisphosphokinase (PRPP-forming) PhnN [Desulfovibrio sp. X2]
MPRPIYLIGASGAGKDSLLAGLRARLDPRAFAFAHRYITRPAESGGENHVSLTRAEFTARLDLGLFALSWESHGNLYGIGREMDLWRAAGLHVVMNGSRAYLPTARERYPDLLPVLVSVPPDVLALRLAARGRETPEEIGLRLERARAYDLDDLDDPACLRIDNSGTLDQSLDRLITALRTAL